MSGVSTALISYLFLAASNIHGVEGSVGIKANIGHGQGYERAELRSEPLNGAYLNRIEVYEGDAAKPAETFVWYGERIERFIVDDVNGDGFPDILYMDRMMERGVLLSCANGRMTLVPAVVEPWPEDGK